MFMLTPFERKTNLLFDDFFDDFDRRFFGMTKPSNANFRAIKTDIKDNGNSYLLEAELPGFDKEDISVDINGDTLMISAEKKSNTTETENYGKYIRKERYYGSYKRSFNLEGINADAIGAKFANGILTLELPKKIIEENASRKLEIQ